MWLKGRSGNQAISRPGLRKMSVPSLELFTHYRVVMMSTTGSIQLQSIRETNRDVNKIRICSHRSNSRSVMGGSVELWYLHKCPKTGLDPQAMM